MHSGKGPKVGADALGYGMNFQTVSTAEKLKSSPAVLIGLNKEGKYTEGPPLRGGYITVDGQQMPGPLLQSALNYVNAALQRMADTIHADGEAASTAIILTAKHGQSPRAPASCSGSIDGSDVRVVAKPATSGRDGGPGGRLCCAPGVPGLAAVVGCPTAHRRRC